VILAGEGHRAIARQELLEREDQHGDEEQGRHEDDEALRDVAG
jgi:hypothetical protein